MPRVWPDHACLRGVRDRLMPRLLAQNNLGLQASGNTSHYANIFTLLAELKFSNCIEAVQINIAK